MQRRRRERKKIRHASLHTAHLEVTPVAVLRAEQGVRVVGNRLRPLEHDAGALDSLCSRKSQPRHKKNRQKTEEDQEEEQKEEQEQEQEEQEEEKEEEKEEEEEQQEEGEEEEEQLE